MDNSKIYKMPANSKSKVRKDTPARVVPFPITTRRRQKISEYIDHLLATAEVATPEEMARWSSEEGQKEKRSPFSFSGPLPIER